MPFVKLQDIPKAIRGTKKQDNVKCWLTNNWIPCNQQCSLCNEFQDYAKWCEEKERKGEIHD